MQIARDIACRLGPPAFFRQPDSVFAGDNAAPLQDLREELIQRALDFAQRRGAVPVEAKYCNDGFLDWRKPEWK